MKEGGGEEGKCERECVCLLLEYLIHVCVFYYCRTYYKAVRRYGEAKNRVKTPNVTDCVRSYNQADAKEGSRQRKCGAQ